MPIKTLSRLSLLALAGVVLPAIAGAQEPSGKAVSVIPDAEALRTAAQVRILLPDQPVFMGDRVKTGPRGEAQLLFSDETRLVVGPESSLLVERYLLKGENTVSNFTVNALRGSFRFITGDSPKNAYAIKTPTATIGVRGTQFDLAIGARGETHLVLFDGSADVCSGGSCVRASDSCSMVQVSPGSRPQAVQDVGQRTQTLRDLFPYVAERANVLRADFQVDARACGLFTQPPLEPGQPVALPPPVVPVLFRAAAPPPPPPPPKPPKEYHHKPKHEHVGHHHRDDDRHRHGPRRDGYERPESRHGYTQHHGGLSDRRGSRGRDRDRDRPDVQREERQHAGRHAGGGFDWTAPSDHRSEDRSTRGERGNRDRGGRDRDGRDGDTRERDGRDRTQGSQGHQGYSKQAGGGVDWSGAHQGAANGPRGRDGRDGKDGRDGRRDNDRHDGPGAAVAEVRGGDRDGGHSGSRGGDGGGASGGGAGGGASQGGDGGSRGGDTGRGGDSRGSDGGRDGGRGGDRDGGRSGDRDGGRGGDRDGGRGGDRDGHGGHGNGGRH